MKSNENVDFPKISVSQDISFKPFNYAQGFQTCEITSAVLCAFVWSPAIFREGRRLSTHFECASWGALDFDDGEYTLEQAKNEWCDTVHFIGTTKSHQIRKNGLICDRFRIVFLWDKIITHSNDYRFNLKNLIGKYGADPACTDPSRFFFPCKEIVSTNFDGYKQTVLISDKPKFSQEEIDAKYEVYKAQGIMPNWIKGLLRSGCPPGHRNKTCFRLGMYMSKLGYSEERITALIVQSPIHDLDFTESEIARAVSNGARVSKKEEIIYELEEKI